MKAGQSSKLPSALVSEAVTKIVLYAYIILLVGFGVLAACTNSRSDSVWVELTRTGFATLGSSLTLILGYYFGQRQVEKEAERAVSDVDKEKTKTVRRLLDFLGEDVTESQPEDISKVTLPPRPPGRKQA